MNPVSLNLPENAQVYNFLFRSRDPAYLIQDLLTVRLQNGFCIDVGWYPEHDINGSYLIRVFRETWDNQIGNPIKTSDLNAVEQIVQQLAWNYNFREVVFSASNPDTSVYVSSNSGLLCAC